MPVPSSSKTSDPGASRQKKRFGAPPGSLDQQRMDAEFGGGSSSVRTAVDDRMAYEFGEGSRSSGQGGSGNSYLSQMRSAADDKRKASGGDSENGGSSGSPTHLEPGELKYSPKDRFYQDFQEYSDENLGGMDLYSFLATDGSQERMDEWRAMVEDPVMGKYYADRINDAGGFDDWYRSVTGTSLDEIMGDPDLMYDYFGTSSDALNDIFEGAAYYGWTPEVGGSKLQQDRLYSLYESDPSLAAATMRYMYGINALSNDEDVSSKFSIDEINDLFDLDQMEFGYGDDYAYDATYHPELGETYTTVDPGFYDESAENLWASVPGYGLPLEYLTGYVNDIYKAGYRVPESVSQAKQAYRDQMSGGQQQ